MPRKASVADGKQPNLVGKWLKRIRVLNGLEQQEFAKYVGRSRSAVNMYERGDRPIPPDVIASVMTAFPDAPAAPLGGEIEIKGLALAPDRVATIRYAGVVPCSSEWGDPLSAEETRSIESKFAGSNRFMCKMSGDSCYPAIQQADLTIWESDEDPPYNVIILAERTEDHACTAKQLVRDPKLQRAKLVAVNPGYMAPDEGEGWKAVARLIAVIRPGDVERTWYNPAGLRPEHLI